MAATDYIIVAGRQNAYFARKKKPTKNGPQVMSKDRRPITDGEIIELFEFYLRKWCKEHEGQSSVVITDGLGKMVFKATLYR